jgi:hypothetical protein
MRPAGVHLVLLGLVVTAPLAAQPAAPGTSPVPAPPPAAAPANAPAAAGFGIHLESYRTADRAAASWDLVKRALAPDLDALGPHVAAVEVRGERVFRLIAGPLERDQAAALCARLQPKQSYCDVVALGTGESVSPRRRALARAEAGAAAPAPPMAPTMGTDTGAAPMTTGPAPRAAAAERMPPAARGRGADQRLAGGPTAMKIGRASCRERVS